MPGLSAMVTSGAALELTEISFDFDPLDLHDLEPERYPFLLESAASGTDQGRFDILFAFPEESLRLNPNSELTGHHRKQPTDFLTSLDDWWRQLGSVPCPEQSLPFYGGWFVLLSYELAGEVEPKLALSPDARLPVAVAVRVPVAVIRDRLGHKAWIVAERGYEMCLRMVQKDLARIVPPARQRNTVLDGEIDEEDPVRFLAAVETAKKHIAAGDIFQANLSREWRGRLRSGVKPADLYRRLRLANPAPFAGLAVSEDFALVSSSPERLLTARGSMVETRPIAGTRPRDPDPGNDAPSRKELLDHPKERAEHVMLIDLERNDLGRICQAGSVEVNEFMVVESYEHVHHIVSNVIGRLRPSTSPGDMIRAVFPGGTITGCPKVRCMEIIHELEGRPRGFYTGSMGYINRDGSADFNILIRTMMIIGRELSVAAGSGIVADSVPELELEETRAKAKGLLLALQ
jgi:anthranilate synthase component 1